MSENKHSTRLPFWRPTSAAAAAITIVAIPGFLVGSFAPQIKEDLNFGDTELGALLTFGYLVSSVIMQTGGGIADRRGPQLIIRTGIFIAAISALLIGTAAQTYVVLLLCIGLNRVGEGLIHPATNTLISNGVDQPRQGIAIATKQSAVPFSTALAGLAVPILGSTVGWEGTFLILAALAFPAWLLIPDIAVSKSGSFPSRRDMWRSRHLRIASIAGAFSAAAVVTMSGFLTTAAEEAGYSESSAGLILGIGGLIMIVARLSWGFLADKYEFDRFKAVSLQLTVGSSAFILLSIGTKTSVLIGSLISFGIGWAWPGLLLLGVIEQHPDDPGAATATLQTSIRVGAMVAPLGFGIVVDNSGFELAWVLAFSSTIVGAILMASASQALKSD
ncbi:MAG: hypothetical protein CL463_03405 [Acidimicrobiaceae bacterium]|nr:hypothetical protein [Acidimicrobiaceae bacterium]